MGPGNSMFTSNRAREKEEKVMPVSGPGSTF